MALLTSEVARLRYELGFNVLSVGAIPYINVTQLFEQVVAPYLSSGASTTSTTAVTAASTPAPVALTLASAVGFNAGDSAIVDVDARRERATVQSVSGSTITVLLSFTHSGTYPITVEGGESIIRGILDKLQALDGLSAGSAAGGFGAAVSTAGIKRVDDIEFFGNASSSGGGGKVTELKKLREYWRDELASAIGIVRLNKAGGGSVAMY